MEQYKIYTVPDEPYLRRLEKESQSGDGSLLAYYEDDLLQGVFAESFEEDEVYIRWAYSLEPEHMINQIKQRHKGKKIISQKEIYSGKFNRKGFYTKQKSTKDHGKDHEPCCLGRYLARKERFYIQDIGERSIYQGSEWSIPVSMSES